MQEYGQTMITNEVNQVSLSPSSHFESRDRDSPLRVLASTITMAITDSHSLCVLAGSVSVDITDNHMCAGWIHLRPSLIARAYVCWLVLSQWSFCLA